MKTGIKQEVCGHLRPLIIGQHTVPGDIQTLVDWLAIANYHKPINSHNYVFKLTLEYLQCDYYISSLRRIPSSKLPDVDELVDSNLLKQTKYAEFKRMFDVKSKHAIELMLHTKWAGSDWGIPKSSEFLYNLKQYGYLNLFDPYLVRDSEIMYSDIRYKIGISIDGLLENLDIIEINGGYSGTISYFEEEVPESLSENAGSVVVSTRPTVILPNRRNRKIAFVSNDAATKLYFRFTNSRSAVSTNSSFLNPGESLSIEFNNFFGKGGNQHQWVKAGTKYYLPLTLFGIRKSGTGEVTYQEFY